MIRRTLARYLILLQVLTFQAVSTSVKKRFPTTKHLVAAGIMTKEERSVYEKVSFVYGKWWLPCQWFSSLAMRARKEGRIKDSILLDALFRELLTFRNSCGTMLSYDWISVPLVYTQVVTLATYMYSAALMVGRQYLDPQKSYSRHEVDLYVPLFTLLQFFFYVGWLKVAEQILNPYGEDDDDFELNWCLDRTVHVVYLIVDSMHMKHPKVRRDFFWDEIEPKLPQTKQSSKYLINPQLGSAFNLEVEDAEYLPMESFLEEDREENMYSSDSVKKRGVEGFRSSFISRVFNSGFAQSFRRKSTRTGHSLRNSPHSQRYANQGFVANSDRNVPSNRSTPAVSRKSSMRSLVRKVSPSNSRTSSMSFRPNSVNRHRHKSYDLQEAEKTQLGNGFVPDADSTVGFGIVPVVRTMSDSTSIAGDTISREGDEKESVLDYDGGGGQRLEIMMPPIPEEPSRATSIASVDSGTLEKSPDKVNEMKSLVREANQVLKELNRTVTAQGHKEGCEQKGYESCCSLSDNDYSSDESGEDANDMRSGEVSVVVEDSKSFSDEKLEKY